MKRSIVMGLALLAMTACVPPDQAQNTATASTSPRTVDLLVQGSEKACSQQDVRETLVSMVKPEMRPTEAYTGADIENALGQFTYNLDLITLAGVDRSVRSISCDANLIVHQANGGDSEYSVRYLIRPSVEDPNTFIVNANTGEAKAAIGEAALSLAYKYAADREAAETPAAPPQPTDSPSPDPTPTADLPPPQPSPDAAHPSEE